MHRGNWDDFRFVLAVAQSGSVSAAARQLGVNHATVLRRVAAFESDWDCAVFDRTPRGYVVHRDRLRLIEAMREIEGAVSGVERQIRGVSAPLRGTVRVTSTDTFCQEVLPPLLTDLVNKRDQLAVHLLCSNAPLDLGRLEADIAVRPAIALPEDMDGVQAARLGFFAYRSAQESDARRSWIGLGGPLRRSALAEWMDSNIPLERISGAADSFLTLREMAAAGLGRALLPCILADKDPRLVPMPEVLKGLSVPIWVACHADLSDVPRIRVVRSRLAQALERQAARLLGSAAT